MNSRLVVFGSDDIGELAHYYFTHDSPYQIVGFTLDGEFIKETSFCGLPVVPFSEVAGVFPSDSHDLFVAIGYSRLNRLRRDKYLAGKASGYRLASYVSSRASVLNEGRIGDNCFILEDNTIQPFVRIGNDVTLWSGNHIGHHATIGDHCFLASHIVVSGRVVIGDSCFIGVNATLRDHVTVGRQCVIGAGAVILGDVESDGIYKVEATPRGSVPSTRLKRI